MAVAFGMVNPAQAEALQHQLRRVQTSPKYGGDGGLPAALHDGLSTGFTTAEGEPFEYYRRFHMGATAWNVFAQVGVNPYYLTSVTDGGPGADLAGRAASDGSWWVAESTGSEFVTKLSGRWSTAVEWTDVLRGDFTGDGHDDIAGRTPNGDWWVAHSTGTRFVNERWGRWNPGAGWTSVQVGDFDGDGRADIVGRAANGDWWIARSTGTGFVNEHWGRWSTAVSWNDIHVGDFNGDGRSDLVGRISATGDWWVALSTGTGFVNERWGRWSTAVTWEVRVGDFTGDGRTDVAGRTAGGDWWIARSNGIFLVNQYWGRCSTAIGWIDQVGDFNGDGLADLVGRAPDGDWWVARSTGTGFRIERWGRWSTAVVWSDVRVGDFTGDGRADVAGRTATTGDWWVARSTGDRFVNEHWGRWSTTVTWNPVLAGSFAPAAAAVPPVSAPLTGQAAPETAVVAESTIAGSPQIIDFFALPDSITTNIGTFVVAGTTVNTDDTVTINGAAIPPEAKSASGVFAFTVGLNPGPNPLELTITSSSRAVVAQDTKIITLDTSLSTSADRLLYVDAVPGEVAGQPNLDGTVVIDVDRDIVLGILTGQHVRGLSASGAELFMADRSVFSTATHQKIRDLDLADAIPPNAFLVSPLGDYAYSRNEAIDLRTNTRAAPLPTDITSGGSWDGASIPGGPAISLDGRTIYAHTAIARIDVPSRTYDPTGVSAGFLSDLAISPDQTRLLASSYSSGSGQLSIWDIFSASPYTGGPIYGGFGDYVGEIGFLRGGDYAVVGSSGNPYFRNGTISLVDLTVNPPAWKQWLRAYLADNLVTSVLDEVFVSTGDSTLADARRVGVDVLALGPDDRLALVKTYFLGINEFVPILGRPKNDQIRRMVLKPAAVFSVNIDEDTGMSGGDNLTSQTNLTLYGTTLADGTVHVLRGADLLGSVVADSGGYWSFDYTQTALPQGISEFSFRVFDAGGVQQPDPPVLTVTVDQEPPSVEINRAPSQPDPTRAPQITLLAVFSEPVTGLDASGVELFWEAYAPNDDPAPELTAAVTGTGTTYQIVVTGMPAAGTVTAQIRPGATMDYPGNLNLASTSSDNSVFYDPPQAQPFPYPGPSPEDVQGFESVEPIDTLPGWRFEGDWSIVESDQAHSGSHHLVGRYVVGGPEMQAAVLRLDLSSQAETSNPIALDFWLHKLDSGAYLDVYVSGDELNWFRLPGGRNLGGSPGDDVHYTFDLRSGMAAAGTALDNDVFLMFRLQPSFAGALALDNLRISSSDVFGPYITAIEPVAWSADEGPLNSVRVTFNEAIDASSMTSEVIALMLPMGGEIAPLGINPVAGSDNTQFDLSFTEQHVRGEYQLTIGAEVRDSAGNLMNQNRDPQNGQPYSDDYSTILTFASRSWEPPAMGKPFVDGFENWPPVPGHWSFGGTGDGTWQVITSDQPLQGSQHLRFTQGSSSVYPSATVRLNLSGWHAAKDAYLNFTAKSSTGGAYMYVSVSRDGTWYSSASGPTWISTGYSEIQLDLDAFATTTNTPLGESFYVRFQPLGLSDGDSFFLDDIRVGRTGNSGPDIVGRDRRDGVWWLAESTGTQFINKLWGRWSTTVDWTDVLVGDFTGDGYDDIAGRTAGGDWWVARSTAAGFVNEHWGRWNPGAGWTDVRTGDFTGDGLTDIVGRTAAGEWWVARSTGERFINEHWGKRPTAVAWTEIQAADFTGDGRADLVGRAEDTGDWWVARSTGTGFVNERWGRWSTSAQWADIRVGDFNGDGRADLAGRVTASGDWWVARSTGSAFANERWGRWSPATVWTDIRVSDFTGDGRADLAGRTINGGDWWVARSTGSGFVNERWGRWSTSTAWTDIHAGDYTGDGLADLAGRTAANGDWWVARSTGAGFINERWGRWSTSAHWDPVLVGNSPPAPAAMQAATAPSAEHPAPQSLTLADLDPIVAAGVLRLPSELQNVAFQVQIADLTGLMLGQAVGKTILIDHNAAGFGWFVDISPLTDAEYSRDRGTAALHALPGGDADGRMDLLTVVMHELGHLLGHDHTGSGLMSESLAPGVRYLWDDRLLDELLGHPLADSQVDDLFAVL